jgi:hypothetical protein
LRIGRYDMINDGTAILSVADRASIKKYGVSTANLVNWFLATVSMLLTFNLISLVLSVSFGERRQ